MTQNNFKILAKQIVKLDDFAYLARRLRENPMAARDIVATWLVDYCFERCVRYLCSRFPRLSYATICDCVSEAFRALTDDISDNRCRRKCNTPYIRVVAGAAFRKSNREAMKAVRMQLCTFSDLHDEDQPIDFFGDTLSSFEIACLKEYVGVFESNSLGLKDDFPDLEWKLATFLVCECCGDDYLPTAREQAIAIYGDALPATMNKLYQLRLRLRRRMDQPLKRLGILEIDDYYEYVQTNNPELRRASP